MTSRPAPIAIVGMAALLPESPNLQAYWRNIVDARDCLTEIPEDHSWSTSDYYDADPSTPDMTWATKGGFIGKIPFDPIEHGVIPVALEAIDTDQLLALIVARECLKDAGINPDASDWNRDRTNIVLGHTSTNELVVDLSARLQHPTWRKAMVRQGVPDHVIDKVVADIGQHYPTWQEQSFPGMLANVSAGRIANRLDLGGTNASVDAACASSLAAIHYAISDLQSGRADLAISGGTDTLNDIFMYMCFSKTPALSKSGDARPFDVDSDGIVISEGIAMFALKRLDDAERDGDRIYAVIQGIGTSSDGKNKSIYAPSSSGQVKAVRRAYDEAGFPLETVELIEAHGTGTNAGDLAEFNGLRTVFSDSSREDRHVAFGSVKSQIGHTKATAGAAGLMKVALALHQKVIPPTAKITAPNPRMDFSGVPLYLNTEAKPWVNNGETPRRAGVSAFGFGGTNYHFAVEEYTGGTETPTLLPAGEALFLFAAETSEALTALLADTHATVDTHPTVHHASQAVLTTWSPKSHIIGFTASSPADLGDKLATAQALVAAGQPATRDGVRFAMPDPEHAQVAVIFPGQGSQYTGMGRTAGIRYPAFRATLDRAEAALRSAGRSSLAAKIYPPPAFSKEEISGNQAALRATEWAQPALGAVSLGWWNTLKTFGVEGHAFAGHSYGELVALHAAGAYSEDALWNLSRVRGEAMVSDDSHDRGTMAALRGPLEAIEALVAHRDDVVLANRNHPTQGVIAGTRDGISAVLGQAKDAGLSGKEIPVSAAFHSPLVADARTPLAEALATTDWSAPTTTVFANATAAPYPSDAQEGRALLADQVVSSVDWVGVVDGLIQGGARTIIECGPKQVLSKLVKRCVSDDVDVELVHVDGGDRVDGDLSIKHALIALACRGVPIDVSPYLQERIAPGARTAGSKATVMLGGANFKRPDTLTPPAPEQPAWKEPIVDPKPTQSSPPQVATPVAQPVSPIQGAALSELLAATRDSLQAFQETQAKTAAVHQAFLEGHAKAQAAFAQLLSAQTRIMERAAGLAPSAPAPSAVAIPAPVVTPIAAPTHEALSEAIIRPTQARATTLDMPRNDGPSISAASDLPPMLSAQSLSDMVRNGDAIPTATPAAPAPSKPAPTVDVKALLLSVVADKTGYPTDLLDMSMDLESDLGVDSIKRVEILSAVQEAMPDAPPIPDDELATLRTLGDVAARLERAVAAPAPAQPAPAASPAVDLNSALIEVVAEKTGYPTDLLNMDMDLESDLGIDSIKRVEILASLQERLPSLPDLPEDELAGARTLEDIAQVASAHLGGTSTSAQAPEVLEQPSTVDQPTLARREVVQVPAPEGRSLPFDGALAVIADDTAFADQLASAFTARGCRSVTTLAIPNASETFALPDGVQAVVLGVTESSSQEDLLNGMTVVKACSQLEHLAIVTGLGGGLGYGQRTGNATQAAFLGLAKTVAQEWPTVRTVAVDIDPITASPEMIAEEIFTERSVVERGLTDETSTLESIEMALSQEDGTPPIEPGDTVVVTGGARGVTSRVVIEMARRWQPHLVLLGRTVRSDSEPDWAVGVADTDLKATRIQVLRGSGAPFNPRALEADVLSVLKDREIQRTLDTITQAGARATYIATDVTDAQAVQNALANLDAPIRGIVHGAGVIADKLLVEKAIEDARWVLDTKLTGLTNVLASCPTTDLKLVAMFSSVAGRYGNRGQADYSMGNEAITQLAIDLKSEGVPHVKSFHWGPWDGGMVSPSLAAAFKAQGMRLVGLESGAQAFCDEFERGGDVIEVVMGGPDQAGALLTEDQRHATPPTLSGEQAVQFNGDETFLADHQIDGNPVLPFVMVMETMANAARQACPGLQFVGIREVAVLKGIVLRDGKTPALTLKWKAAENANEGELSLAFELLGEPNKLGLPTLHYRGTVDMGAKRRPSARFPGSNGLGKQAYPYPVDEAYQRFLFHGPGFQGIESIRGMSDHGIVGTLASSRPKRLGVDASHWTTDPVALDSALQLVGLWVREQRGASALPTYVQNYKQVAPLQGLLDVHIELEPTKTARGTFHATFVDEAGRVVAQVEGGQYTAMSTLNDRYNA